MNETSVDAYLAEGCGRCELYRTPQCKVHLWTDPLVALREQVLASGLTETMKWGAPCYTLGGKNVAMLSALKDFAALSFFEGALLDDVHDLLEAPGPHTRHARLVKFTSVEQVQERADAIADYLAQAIANERSGKRVPRVEAPEPLPEELQALLDAEPRIAAAFEALTPGRRRSYVLHVGGAKQSKTRAKRAVRCAPKILTGKGFNER
ncbi:MAG: YdeI/OmpD-associated family protein [Myxococcota bacterium]